MEEGVIQLKHKTIYSLWVMLDLAKLGFKPLMERANPKDRNLSCWDYEVTPEFEKALSQILGK